MSQDHSIVDFKNDIDVIGVLFEIHLLHLCVLSLFCLDIFTVLNCLGLNAKPFSVSLDVLTSRRIVLGRSTFTFKSAASTPVVSSNVKSAVESWSLNVGSCGKACFLNELVQADSVNSGTRV